MTYVKHNALGGWECFENEGWELKIAHELNGTVDE